MSSMSFMSASMKYFGKKPGQSLTDFGKEVKQLTPEDRKDLTPALEQQLGVTIGHKPA